MIVILTDGAVISSGIGTDAAIFDLWLFDPSY